MDDVATFPYFHQGRPYLHAVIGRISLCAAHDILIPFGISYNVKKECNVCAELCLANIKTLFSPIKIVSTIIYFETEL